MNKYILLSLSLIGLVSCVQAQGSVITFSTPERDNPGPVSCDAQGNVYTIISSEKTCKLVKINPSGQKLWTMEDSSWRPSGIRISGEDIFVTGSFRSGWQTGNGPQQSKGMDDIFIARYSLSGEERWVRTAGGVNSESGRFIDVSANGHVFVSGTFYGNISIGNTTINHLGESDVFLTCFDTDGNKLWAKGVTGYLSDELYNMVWLEQKEKLLLNMYLQLSANLGNSIITSDNSFVTAAYDEGGTARALLQETGNLLLSAIDTAAQSIYMHSGTHYYDSTGTLYSYNYEFEKQFSVKVRKGAKSIIFKGQSAYIFGTTPVIVNSVVREVGYLDAYDESWTLRAGKTLDIDAGLYGGCLSSGSFWFSGSFTDTADLYGHSLVAANKGQDAFLMRLDAQMLGIQALAGQSRFILFPNPAAEFIALRGEAGNEPYSIFDASGRMVMTISVNHLDHIDISGLSPGLYYLRSAESGSVKFTKT